MHNYLLTPAPLLIQSYAGYYQRRLIVSVAERDDNMERELPKLLDQVQTPMLMRHMSLKTERSFTEHMRKSILVHNKYTAREEVCKVSYKKLSETTKIHKMARKKRTFSSCFFLCFRGFWYSEAYERTNNRIYQASF
jgi:hypothetical protein